MRKKVIPVALIVIFASIAACLSETESPVAPQGISEGSLLVDTGFTNGAPHSWVVYNLGEYSAFTLRWSEVNNAQFYEIRASEEPITSGNWGNAIPVATVLAPADSTDVFNVVEVQYQPCIGCGMCEVVCPVNAITVQNGTAVIDYTKCTSCGQCMDVCPVDAITGTKNGTNYFFGIRAFFNENSPATDISTTDDSYRIIFFNAYGSFWGPITKNCGLCRDSHDSLGVYGGCHILNDYFDQDRATFTGYGCPEDAIWQDSLSLGPVPGMIYIDYDKCTTCGICFTECWNYNLVIDPQGGYEGMKTLMHKVVPSGWVSPQPQRP